MPITENFDGVTAPALPSGWTQSGSLFSTTTSGTPVSSPNQLQCSATSTGTSTFTITYPNLDTSGGNVTVSAKVAGTGTSPGKAGVVFRSSSKTPDVTGSFYAAWWDTNANAAGLYLLSSGTLFTLGSRSAGVAPTGRVQVIGNVAGSTLSVQAIDLGNGKYLDSSGAWVVSAATALSLTDTTLPPVAGYMGVFAGKSFGTWTAYFDDWSSDILILSLYAGDSGAGSDGSLRSRLTSDATAESESFLESFRVVDTDFGTAVDSGLSVVLAAASTPLLEIVGLVLTAPDPTAWATDSTSAASATRTIAFASSAGSGGSLDSAGGAESWRIATTLIVADSAAESEAWRSSRIVTYAGYRVYRNAGAGEPIDYATPVAELVGLAGVTWTSGRLSVGTWSFGVRAFSPNGEEQNVDVAATIVISAAGSDVSNIPDPPRALSAVAVGGGKVAVHWIYPIVAGPAAPTGFRVYKGIGTVDYSTPVATVTAGTQGTIGRYTATVSGLADRTAYVFGVRAYNATGEETNTLAASATARATGPNAVRSLTIQSTT